MLATSVNATCAVVEGFRGPLGPPGAFSREGWDSKRFETPIMATPGELATHARLPLGQRTRPQNRLNRRPRIANNQCPGNPEPGDCVVAGNMNPERVAKTQELNQDGCRAKLPRCPTLLDAGKPRHPVDGP